METIRSEKSFHLHRKEKCVLDMVYGSHLSVVKDDLEEGVHQQDSVGLNTTGVQENRLGGPVKRVGVEDGLDHDQGLGQVLHVQHVSVKKPTTQVTINFFSI